jgi:hypothetical protein
VFAKAIPQIAVYSVRQLIVLEFQIEESVVNIAFRRLSKW